MTHTLWNIPETINLQFVGQETIRDLLGPLPSILNYSDYFLLFLLLHPEMVKMVQFMATYIVNMVNRSFMNNCIFFMIKFNGALLRPNISLTFHRTIPVMDSTMPTCTLKYIDDAFYACAINLRKALPRVAKS